MKILDLFCGGGGASDGYKQAYPNAEITGVDIDPQPYYPYTFYQKNALTFDISDYDLIHASPPCQGYSNHVSSSDSIWVPTRGKNEPQLIDSIRKRLIQNGRPYIIENVTSARWALRQPITLCGSMFGLDIPRHRLFETSWDIPQPKHPKCRGIAKSASERLGWEYRDMTVTGKGRHSGTSQRWSQLLGINREMRQHDYAESIPPAYTKWLGKQLPL